MGLHILDEFIAMMRFSFQPKHIFLLDGTGALLTAISTGIVLASMDAEVGLPKHVLWGMGAAAGLFAIYDYVCAALLPKRWPSYLKGIMAANVAYCLVAAVLLVYFRDTVKWPGWVYFSLEALIVAALVYYEWQFIAQSTPHQERH